MAKYKVSVAGGNVSFAMYLFVRCISAQGVESTSPANSVYKLSGFSRPNPYVPSQEPAPRAPNIKMPTAGKICMYYVAICSNGAKPAIVLARVSERGHQVDRMNLVRCDQETHLEGFYTNLLRE